MAPQTPNAPHFMRDSPYFQRAVISNFPLSNHKSPTLQKPLIYSPSLDWLPGSPGKESLSADSAAAAEEVMGRPVSPRPPQRVPEEDDEEGGCCCGGGGSHRCCSRNNWSWLLYILVLASLSLSILVFWLSLYKSQEATLALRAAQLAQNDTVARLVDARLADLR